MHVGLIGLPCSFFFRIIMSASEEFNKNQTKKKKVRRRVADQSRQTGDIWSHSVDP